MILKKNEILSFMKKSTKYQVNKLPFSAIKLFYYILNNKGES